MELVRTCFLGKQVYEIDLDISHSYISDYTVVCLIYLCVIIILKNLENHYESLIRTGWLMKNLTLA